MPKLDKLEKNLSWSFFKIENIDIIKQNTVIFILFSSFNKSGTFWVGGRVGGGVKEWLNQYYSVEIKLYWVYKCPVFCVHKSL